MEHKELGPSDKKALLRLARTTISNRLGREEPPAETETTGALSEPAGAFVTLHKHGRLRGCIGTFSADSPVRSTVRDMALAAAFRDPRFPPLGSEELADIDLEISVLTPMREIASIDEIEVGRHGIYITQGPYSGVLLPQVATENHWDRQTFLEQTCYKAGLDTNAWKSKKTKIYVFSAQVFGELD